MDAFAKYYHRDKNPDDKHIPGVKLADFTQAEWDELPEHLRRSADATGFYADTAPDESAPEGGPEGGTLPPAAINQVVQAAVQAAVKAVQAPTPTPTSTPPPVVPPPVVEKESQSNG